MRNNLPGYLLERSDPQTGRRNSAKLSFLDKTVLKTAKTVKSIYLQEESAASENFVRRINPYVKLISLIYIVVVISFTKSLNAQVFAAFFILSLFIIARLNVADVYLKILFLAFIFGFLVVLPAALNIITPGKILIDLVTLDKPHHFWIYNIPQNIGLTDKGILVVILIFMRVLNSVSFALLIVFTTPFPSFIKTFRLIGIPDTFIMIINLTYKYIFILSRTIEEAYFALKSRLCGNLRNDSIRKLVGGRIFFIFKRSQVIYEGTYNAMVSRGYRGKVHLSSGNKIGLTDIISLVVIAAAGIAIILI